MDINKVKPINKKKLQIKYITRTYTKLVGYPTPIDILFELASDNEIINNLQFDYNYAKYILSDKIVKQKYDECMLELIDQKYIQCITSGKKIMYKLLKHPWE